MTDLLLQAAILAVASLLLVMEVWRTLRGRRREREFDATARRLRDDMQALCTGAANMGKHLATLEQKLRRVSERQDQLELRDPAQQTYGHAIRLAQRGADVDELVAQCGLARGEAELLLRLHRNTEPTHCFTSRRTSASARLDIRQSIFLESAAGDAVVAGYFQLRLADVITLRVVRAPLVEQLE